MTVPDNDLIAEVLLTCEGFTAAASLATKMVALFSLSRELLSRQQHYDWGLRALKTALGAAGRLLQEARRATQQAEGGQNAALAAAQEAEVVVRGVCATKLPTLTIEDNARFRGLLADLFPGVSITDASNPSLEAAVAAVAADQKLELTPQQVCSVATGRLEAEALAGMLVCMNRACSASHQHPAPPCPQIEKVLQLHLACEQRIGVILVGPSGSGKSTLWQVLEAAYARLNRWVQLQFAGGGGALLDPLAGVCAVNVTENDAASQAPGGVQGQPQGHATPAAAGQPQP